MTELDRWLEQAILSLLSQRDPGMTICPSEAARAVSAAAWEGNANRPWRALMDLVRSAAARLVAAGRIEVTQMGAIVDIEEARGPVRLRLRLRS